MDFFGVNAPPANASSKSFLLLMEKYPYQFKAGAIFVRIAPFRQAPGGPRLKENWLFR
jgi:hypothetical protein